MSYAPHNLTETIFIPSNINFHIDLFGHFWIINSQKTREPFLYTFLQVIIPYSHRVH